VLSSDPIPVRRPAWRDAAAAIALLAAILLVYVGVFRAGFIWDDDTHVTANPVIVGPLGLKEIWTTSAANYFPLVLTSYRLQHALWGLDPLGYHLVTLACHALAAMLLWRVLVRLDVPGAWLGAALWALHPVQVESVAWISELKNTQSAVFFLLSIWLWLRWLEAGRRRFYFLALAAALLAVLSKPSTVMLPVVLGLCVWWRHGEFRLRAVRALVPFFALSLLVSAWTVWEQKFHSGAQGAEWALSFADRLAVAGRATWFYLGKLVWPEPLIFIYPRWEIDAGRIAAWLPTVGALAAGLAVAWRLRTGRSEALFFAAAYFAVLLFPVLGFFDVYFFRYSYVADHFQYLASIGPLALAGAAVSRLRRGPAVAASVLLLASCAGLTSRHAATFSDNETLWRTSLAANPDAPMAWLNLGLTLASQGRDDEAIACFHRSAEIRPGDAEARNDAGWALVNAGFPAAAVPLLEEVLRLKPDHAEAHNTLGNALRRLGRLDEAAQHYSRSLTLKPGSAEAHNNLGGIFAETGRLAEAMVHFEDAIRISPGFAPAHANLGAALCLSARWSEAIVRFETALRVRPDYPDAHRQLGIALANAGRMNEAAVALTAAIRLAPESAELHRNLGQVLVALGRKEEAKPHIARAERLRAEYENPSSPSRR
jgi:protein O-mannosyl-transferase